MQTASNKRRITEEKKRSDKRNSLLLQVMVALLAALLVGALLRRFGSEALQNAISEFFLEPVRTVFLNALKMLVVPLVFFAISYSLASVSNLRDYGRIGGKVLGFYTFTSLLAILTGWLVYTVLRPDRNVGLDSLPMGELSQTASDFSFTDTIVNIVPSSLFGAFTGYDMLQIIFLAVIVGTAANLMDGDGDRTAIRHALGLIYRLFLKLASIVMKLIPPATFCAMVLLLLSADTQMLSSLLRLILGMLLGAVIMFAVYGVLFYIKVRRNPLRFYGKCLPNFLSFITFCSTGAVMPQSLDTCTRRLGISPKVSSFSMPLGSTINMDGACIYLMLCSLYLAGLYGVSLDPGTLIRLALTILILSMGAPPVSGAGFLCLAVLVQQLGLPDEYLGILMGIDGLMSMLRTLINGTGDFVGTAVVAQSEGFMDMTVFDKA